VLASVALADDYAAGEAAWQRGEHAAALAQWLPLAEAGQARAQFAVGLAYDRGQGVERDAATAAEAPATGCEARKDGRASCSNER
jgi:TPR repeat protein